MRYVGSGIRRFQLSDDQSDYLIPIPPFHRAAVGLFPGTKLYATPIKNTREITITSIVPTHWGDIWRIDANLKDLPGAVESIIRTLNTHKVNILVEESTSQNTDGDHALFLIVDLAGYSSEYDGGSTSRNSVIKPNYHPSYLLNEIISNSVDFLKKKGGDSGWDIEIKRLSYFFNHKENRNEYREMSLNDGKIALKCKDVHDWVFRGDTRQPSVGFITSDTEEKCLKITFLDSTHRYLMLEIYHKEEHGAILQIMEQISKRKINIVASYTRLFRMNLESVWYGILAFPLDFQKGQLRNFLAAIDRLSVLHGRFSIVGHYNWDFDIEQEQARWGLPRLFPSRASLAARSAEALVKAGARDPSEPHLVVEPFYRGKSWRHENNSVFIAIPFHPDGGNMYQTVYAPLVRSMKLKPTRVDLIQTAGNDAIIDVIMRKIATCKFMIADVSEQNPNVMYEVALGHAIGKTVILCSEEDRKKEKNLAFDIRDKAHFFYAPGTMDTFRRKLRAKIRAVLSGTETEVPFTR